MKISIGTAELIVRRKKPGDDNIHDENDTYVMARARINADAPYDQDTCRRYPWAAAARIRYLEGVIAAMKRD